jgi:metal-sulfur cluster biosynthetic enzyme
MSRTHRRDVSRAVVRERLDTVTDPELDRSIVELDYVDRLEIDPPRVHVEFTLPTAWCSPAFAWMMAVDIRDAVEDIEGIDHCTVDLQDHMHGEEITEGANAGDSFEETFEEATEDIGPTRAKFDEKALFARQYELVEALLEAGIDSEQIRTLSLADCTVHAETGSVAVDLDGLSVCIDEEPFSRYVEKAEAMDVVSDPDEPLFRNRDHEPIESGRFERVHAEARVTTVNMRGQGGVCDALHEARYGDARPEGDRYAWESGADD